METQLISTQKFPEMGYNFEKFNPFQSKFYPEYDKDTNVVVAAPTGSGKTVIAEMCVYSAVVENEGRAIFLGPMKALAKEKFDSWTEEKHPFNKKGVSILTGDYKLTEAKKKELNQNKVILMTSEMLDSRSRRMKAEKNEWLLKTNVLIIDESHIIGMWNDGTTPLQERGHRLECAIVRFTKLNPNCRIVMLSATLPNLPELGAWLTKLNQKETKIIVSNWTPQPVTWHEETYLEEHGYGSYHINKARMFESALTTIEKFSDDMWLIFCHSKKDGRTFKNRLEKHFNCEIPFHSADLEKNERKILEDSFREKKTKIIIATSTLAYGMNLPARRVMILDYKRGLNEVHPYDIKQMGGRAGRPGIDPRGDVHWVIGERSVKECFEKITNLPEAKSLMNDIGVFAFHIVAEIAEGGIQKREEVKKFFEKTLACHQGITVSDEWFDQLINTLIKTKTITNGDKIRVTPLGRIASWMYFSPFDVYDWYRNFDSIFNKNRLDDIAISWAWSSINSNSLDYIPKDCIDETRIFDSQLHNLGSLKGCAPACIGTLKQIQEKEKSEIPSSVISWKRKIVFDVERYAQTILLIDNMFAHWGKAQKIKMIATRIAYGVGWEAASLCLLPKIGRVRSKQLINNGIKSPQDLIKKEDLCRSILGKIYDQVKEKVEELIGENK